MILFYVNPTAGSGHAKKVWQTLEPYLQKHQIPYTAIIDANPNHALSRLRSAHSLKPKALFVIGGDGTLSSVVNAIIGSLSDPQAIRSMLASIPFALIPAGSGNDIARSLALPKDPLLLFDRTYKALQNTSTVFLDIAWHRPDPSSYQRASSYPSTPTPQVASSHQAASSHQVLSSHQVASTNRGASLEESAIHSSPRSLALPRVAVGFLGIGFDGEVVYGLQGRHPWVELADIHEAHIHEIIDRSKYNLTKKTMRRLSYTVGVLKTLKNFQPFDLTLSIDGDKRTFHEVWMAALLNVTHFGGGMRISPNSRFDDGLWDLIVVHKISKGAFLRTFPRVFLGRHLTHPAVFYRRGQSFTFTIIQQRKTIYAQQDGDLIALPRTVDILPRALPFVLPQTV